MRPVLFRPAGHPGDKTHAQDGVKHHAEGEKGMKEAAHVPEPHHGKHGAQSTAHGATPPSKLHETAVAPSKPSLWTRPVGKNPTGNQPGLLWTRADGHDPHKKPNNGLWQPHSLHSGHGAHGKPNANAPSSERFHHGKPRGAYGSNEPSKTRMPGCFPK